VNDDIRNRGTGGKKIRKWILKKQSFGLLFAFTWLQTGAVVGSCDHSWKGTDVQIYFLKTSHTKHTK